MGSPLAEYIATLPQEAIRTDKEAAYRGYGMELKEGLRVAAHVYHLEDARTLVADGVDVLAHSIRD